MHLKEEGSFYYYLTFDSIHFNGYKVLFYVFLIFIYLKTKDF